MESKLEQLKSIVADMFANAEDKKAIDDMAKINTAIDSVEKEQKELMAKNAELISSYKDLVKHTSFQPSAATEPKDPTGSQPISFEDALREFVEKNK